MVLAPLVSSLTQKSRPSRVTARLKFPVYKAATLISSGVACSIGAVSIGNPHALTIVNDVKTRAVSHLGPKISQHEAFPEACNAGFAEIIDREHIHLRVYERGSAETLACGTGACAAVSILRRADLVSETVCVTQSGGDLIITWTGGEKPVIMTGPATHVFEGNIA